jgi:hypothetical protein
MTSNQEKHRLECEARSWLRQGYTTPQLVDDLLARIATRRGQAAADALREEMRRQWRLSARKATP